VLYYIILCTDIALIFMSSSCSLALVWTFVYLCFFIANSSLVVFLFDIFLSIFSWSMILMLSEPVKLIARKDLSLSGCVHIDTTTSPIILVIVNVSLHQCDLRIYLNGNGNIR